MKALNITAWDHNNKRDIQLMSLFYDQPFYFDLDVFTLPSD